MAAGHVLRVCNFSQPCAGTAAARGLLWRGCASPPAPYSAPGPPHPALSPPFDRLRGRGETSGTAVLADFQCKTSGTPPLPLSLSKGGERAG
jgi:hypothetical protein